MTTKRDSLGDRMKGYESIAQRSLCPKIPVILRIDGKTFHTYTKSREKPFCKHLKRSFEMATMRVMDAISGCLLAYHQSDEVSFLIRDDAGINTEGWFAYKQNKMESVAASMFTAYFNLFDQHYSKGPAFFDARAFSIPEHDIPNYFLWRVQDCKRNSISAAARAVFSHKELHAKTSSDRLDMLRKSGNPWDMTSNAFRYGTFYDSVRTAHSIPPNYEDLNSLIGASTELSKL